MLFSFSCLLVSVLVLAPIASARVPADFNGDGRSDLAIGVPDERVAGKFQAGAINVLYGGRSRIGLRRNRRFTEDAAGVRGPGAAGGDRFGSVVAAGDFNGNGYADLAIGSPAKDLIPPAYEAGAVHILYGTRHGLTSRGSQYLTEDSPGLAGGGAQLGVFFGAALASGDFDGDGRDDLAIGAPNRNVTGPGTYDGAIHVLYGGRHRLSLRGDQYLTESTRGMAGPRVKEAGFGGDLGVGDLNGDGRADLAIGAARERVSGNRYAGAVRLLYGGRHRLSLKGDRFLTQDTQGMKGDGAEFEDRFGSSFGIGRFNRDRRADLAIGAPGECLAACDTHIDGAVHVLYGGRRGISVRANQYLTQRSPGMKGSNERGLFGLALAGGDLNGRGPDELAIGAPVEKVSGTAAGVVHVIYAANRSLSSRKNQVLTQAAPGMAGPGPESEDQFGFSLGVGDFNGNGRDDLAIGETQDDYDYEHDKCVTTGGGAFHILYGGRPRLSLQGNQFLTQDTPGMAGDGSEPCDAFGSALPSGSH